MTITTRLMGGLGNQLFQYAAGRILARHHKTTLLLDNSFLTSHHATTTKRDYELAPFAIIIDGVKSCQPTAGDRLVQEDKLAMPASLLSAPANSFLIGYWQGHFYLDKLRDELLATIAPTKPLSPLSQKLLAMIQTTDSVFIHVRRGDYAHLPAATKFHGLLPMAYYHKAIKLLQRARADANFFIFSDDPNWAKEHLPIKNSPTIYVAHNQGKDAWQDLILMSHCRHAIMANSSFSFWGGYLSWLRHGKTAVIVAPKPWFRRQTIDPKIWFPDDWRLLTAQSGSVLAPIYRHLKKLKRVLILKKP